jgi:hypothetical protein
LRISVDEVVDVPGYRWPVWDADPMNRLADATSPYLIQHADNPVDWYQWGEEVIDRLTERLVPCPSSLDSAAAA